MWPLIKRLLEGGEGRCSALPQTPAQEPLELPMTYQEAALGLTDWDVVRGKDHKTKLVKTPRDEAHPEIVRFYQRFSKDLEARGIPMYAFEFYRSHERQARLYKQRVTKAKAGQSPHNFGLAVDVVHSTRFWELDRKEWDVIGLIGKEAARKAQIPIVWGGDWDFWDPAHWELKDWRKMALGTS